MNPRTCIAGGATALAMVGVFGLAGATPAGAAPLTTQTTVARQAADLPVVGKLADGTPFTGALSNLTTSVVDGVIMLSGNITGTGIPATATSFGAPAPFSAPVTPAVTKGCKILTLDLGPLNLDLLGLVVDLAPVDLDVTAAPGAGKLLSNLLCAVAHLLDGPPNLQDAVSTILNHVLSVLGGAPAAPAPGAPAPPIVPGV